MTPSTSTARGSRLSSSFGLAERVLATPAQRRLVAALDEGLERVEEALAIDVASADSIADVTSRYLLDAGGKRVRPTLALLTAHLGAGIDDGVLAVARSVELVHLASLYHDDVMDDAPMRRGVPTAQSVWGNSVAILTGDLLFARASQLVAPLGEEVIQLQADTFQRLCLGQLHETVGPREGEDAVAYYLQVLADKTGSLIATSAEMGVMLGAADPALRGPVREYGEKVGVAFQIADDVIDLSPRLDETGKSAGTDLRAGVVTLPLLYLREQAAAGQEGTADAAAALLDELASPDDAVFAAAVERLRQHDATARTIAEAHRWADEAVAALAPLPSGPVVDALTRFARGVVDRQG